MRDDSRRDGAERDDGRDARRGDVAALFGNGDLHPMREKAREASARLFGVAPDRERPLAEGETLGPYRIRRLLGCGGQGLVYEAWHQALGRKAAVKVPRRDVAERLVREAQATARLEHDAIVRVDDIGRDGDRPYLAMELCSGGSLAERLRSHPTGLPVGAVCAAAKRVLAALGHAHRNGFVHRDVKPQNILFDREGRAKLCDFGIGIWAVTDPKLRASLTLSRGMSGKVCGTPLYIAPEQEDPSLRGGKPLDGRADLFSFGKVLFEMLTGASPRTVRPPSTLRPDLDRRWDNVVFRLVQEDPDRRFPDAAAAWEAIAPLASTGDPEIPLLERAGFVRRRHPRPAGKTYLGLLALSGLGELALSTEIPTFQVIFTDMGIKLPWISEMVVGHPWAIWTGFMVVGLCLYPFARRSHRRAAPTAIFLLVAYFLLILGGVFTPLYRLSQSIS